MSSPTFELSTGLVLGAVIGATVLLTNFCALGGIADILFAKDWRRFRAWALAAGVATVGVHGFDSLGAIQLDRAQALNPYILWLPALAGGVFFGFGMALGGGCISRGLARAGAGSVKSLAIVAVIGLSAAATMTILGPLHDALDRAVVLETFGPGGFHRIFGNIPFVDAEVVRWAVVAIAGGGAIWFALKDPWFRRSHEHMLGGFIIGAVVVAAWLAAWQFFETSGTGAFTAINFVPPLGDLALMMTGGAPELLPFALTLGVPLGAFIAGALTRNLALDTFAVPSEIVRSLIGAGLMGFGGTIGMGCTFGQGLSGVSTLSPTAFIATAGIIGGCVWGIRYHEAGSVWGGLKLALRRG